MRPYRGSKWLCIKNFPSRYGEGLSYTSGIIYKSIYDYQIMDNSGVSYYWSNRDSVFNLYKYFRRIPRNKRWNSLGKQLCQV